MKFVKSLVLLLLLSLPVVVFGQRDNNYDYSSEIIWGVNKNTNSGLIGGFMLKYGHEIKDGLFQTFAVEIVNVKHPQEFRYWSQLTGSSFIWAKQNYLYAMRFQYGREKILYRKAPQQGVQINAHLAGGPSLGILAPYYIEWNSGSQGTIREPFDPARHNLSGIVGTGRILQGIGESSIVPGLNLKASLVFEFGTFKSNVAGFELGFMGEAFTREVVLIPTANNQAFFTSAFITLFYGNRY